MTLSNITHHHTDSQIEGATRDELLTAIGAKFQSTNPRKLSKAELVTCAKAERDTLRATHQQAQADAEATRQATIATEKADGLVATILGHAVVGLDSVLKQPRATLAKFHAAMQKPLDEVNIGREICYYGRELMEAQHTVDALATHRNFLAKQAQEQTYTMAQVLEFLGDELKRCQRDLLRDGYRHNSTSAMDNLDNMAQFKGLQVETGVLQQLLRAINEDLADPANTGRPRCLSTLAW